VPDGLVMTTTTTTTAVVLPVGPKKGTSGHCFSVTRLTVVCPLIVESHGILFRKTIFQAWKGKLWKIAKVMESHGK